MLQQRSLQNTALVKRYISEVIIILSPIKPSSMREKGKDSHVNYKFVPLQRPTNFHRDNTIHGTSCGGGLQLLRF